MNASLVKESVGLRVAFVGALLLIVLPNLIWRSQVGELSYVLLGLGGVLMGAYAFGNEFQHRTLSLLLSQPVSRSVLWRDKMLILGLAIAVSWAATVICLRVYWPSFNLATPLILALIALCAFCGAPYWTLRSRQGIGGMAFAAAAPVAIGMMTGGLCQLFSIKEEVGSYIGIGLLMLYCPVVYWRGYVRFTRLEAVDAAARELTLPDSARAMLAQPLAQVGARFQGPFAALLKKELRLQQTSFLLAGVFVVLAVVGFALSLLGQEWAKAVVAGAYMFYVPILPLIAGALSVTEEKGWEVAEWHLTLPPSALQQWSAKMLVTLSTSLVLGLILPVAMALAGQAIVKAGGAGHSLPPAAPMLCAVLEHLLFTSVAVYAGSLSKGALRAIVIALGSVVGSFGVFFLVGTMTDKVLRHFVVDHAVPWGGADIPVLCASLFLLLVLTQRFAWVNFRHSGLPGRRLVAQVLLLFLAICLGSLAINGAMFLTRVASQIQGSHRALKPLHQKVGQEVHPVDRHRLP